MKRFFVIIIFLAGLIAAQDSLNQNENQLKDIFTALQKADSIKKADSVYRANLISEIASLRDFERSKRSALESKLFDIQKKDSLKKIQLKSHIDSLKSVVTGFPVIPFDDTLFVIYNRSGVFNASQRASEFTKRIIELEENFEPDYDSLAVVSSEQTSEIYFGDRIIVSVSEMDALWNDTSRDELSDTYLRIITGAIQKHREETGWLILLKQIFLALLVIFIQYWLIKLGYKYFGKLDLFIADQKDKRIKSISIQDYEVLNSETLVRFVQLAAKGIKYITIVFILYITLPILFSIFPITENIASTLFGYILNPLSKIYHSFVDYIPNLITIIVIFVVTNYAIKVIRYFTNEVENKKLNIKGFYSDWARPTFNIIRFLLYAFMFIIIFPYLPGSDSAIFQGVSVFLGIILSLGSSTAISNMVAGLVITYMRSFRIGDRIKINAITGDVIEKTPIVTRVQTSKNEIITIPNSTILTSEITNYTQSAKEKFLILHTSVTIGYDVPWRKVHELLLGAAAVTNEILKSPEPFVLQTSLDDFYVSYQLNVYTQYAEKQPRIYSELHQNIQDKFNEAGVEIMSPHYRAERDGSEITIPKNYQQNK